MADKNYSSVSAFLAKFQGGARPNRFRVSISGPQAGSSVPDSLMFVCWSASIPASILGRCDVAYMGNTVKISGDREFDDWDIQCYNDLSFDVRKAFEQWSNGMLKNEANVTDFQFASTYLASGKVEQLDRNETVIQTYKMEGVFPIRVGEIELDYSNQNQVESFPVTLAVNWWSSDVTS